MTLLTLQMHILVYYLIFLEACVRWYEKKYDSFERSPVLSDLSVSVQFLMCVVHTFSYVLVYMLVTHLITDVSH